MLQIYYYDIYGLKPLKTISSARAEIFVSDSEFPYIYRVLLRNDKWVISGVMSTTEFTKLTKYYYKEDHAIKAKNNSIIRRRQRIVSSIERVDSGIKFSKEITLYIREMRKKIFGKEFFDKTLNVFFNKRYNTKLNSSTFLVNFEDLDPESMLFRLSSSDSFHKYWNIFTKNYKNLKPTLQKNLWARQKFISFLVKHNKMNKLGLKRYKWIMDSTPEFYLMGFKTREVSNFMHCGRHPHNKKVYSECKFIEQINKNKEASSEQFGCEYDGGLGKWPCRCDKKDCYFITKSRIFEKKFNYRYGNLNNTKAIYNAFVLNKQDLVCVHDHFSTLEFFYKIDPHYFVGYEALDIYGKSKSIKDYKLFFKNNKDYLKKYIDSKTWATKHNSNHFLLCRKVLMNIVDHGWGLLDTKTQIKLQKIILTTI